MVPERREDRVAARIDRLAADHRRPELPDRPGHAGCGWRQHQVMRGEEGRRRAPDALAGLQPLGESRRGQGEARLHLRGEGGVHPLGMASPGFAVHRREARELRGGERRALVRRRPVRSRLVDHQPRRHERVDRGLVSRRDVGIDGDVEAERGMLRQPQSRHRLVALRREVPRIGIERIGAGDHLEHQGGVRHVAGDRREGGEAPEGLGEAMRVRHRPVARLEADEAAMAGRTPAGAASVRAERDGDRACRHDRRAAARRASRRQCGVERIEGVAIEGRRRIALGGKFRAGANGEDDGTGRAQPRHGGRVAGRHEVGEIARALGDAPAADPDVVLDHQRHAGEGQRLAPAIGQRPGRRKRLRLIDQGQCVEARLRLPAALQRVARHRQRIERSAIDALGDLACALHAGWASLKARAITSRRATNTRSPREASFASTASKAGNRAGLPAILRW